jgi:hypothetical protein
MAMHGSSSFEPLLTPAQATGHLRPIELVRAARLPVRRAGWTREELLKTATARQTAMLMRVKVPL